MPFGLPNRTGSPLAASSFTSWFVPYGVSRLDDRDNSRRLEELARSVGGALYAAIDFRELLSPFGNLQRAYVIHARWVEFARHGLRACIVTNVGSPGRGRVATVLSSQVVAVFLPGAAVGHLLQPATVWSTPDPYPHIVLSARSTSSLMTEAVAAGLPIDPRFWHSRDGRFATELTGPHGFHFASCIDGVLYARSEASKLDPSAALAAVDEVVALARMPWNPPTESEIARQRVLSVAYRDRSRRVRKIAWIAFVGYAVGAGLVSWCLLHGR
jgi:hypothetical protein